MPTVNSWRGLDTETQDGRAILLCTDSECLKVRTFGDVARFLLARPGSYAAFNMDYDARAIIKLLPRALWKRLHILNHAKVKVRGVGEINLTYYKRKEFALAQGKNRTAVYDVWQYYQSGSLEATATKVLGFAEGKRKLPKSWLPKMGWALKAHPHKVGEYCRRDSELAVRLMDRVRTQFETLGLNFSRPLSPASMASRYFGPRIRFKLERWVNNIFRECYNGGRIECFKRGAFTGTLYGYDINSAYPWALSRLPNPTGGQFLHVGPRANRGVTYGAYRVKIDIPPDSMPFGPVPWESKRGLIYPTGRFTRWIDRITLDYLRGFDSIDVGILDAHELIGHSKEPLFPDLETLYRERKLRPDISLAIKIVLNGLYGKMAQAVPIYGTTRTLGGNELFYEGTFRAKRDRYASYTHFGIASAVTSMVRNRLHATMLLKPESIIMAATDGLLTSVKLPIPEGKNLGDWAIKYVSDTAYIVGSGVYACHHSANLCPCEPCTNNRPRGELCRDVPGKTPWDEKVRGLRGARPLRELLTSKKAKWPISVTVVDSLADGIREREARMNVIRKAKRTFDVNFDNRRVWPGNFKRACDMLNPELAQQSESIILL